MEINLIYAYHYQLQVMHDKCNQQTFYYPGATDYGKDGLTVEVTSSIGEKWVGVFAYGDISKIGADKIFSMPQEDRFCVVSRGAGYIVSSGNPNNWNTMSFAPIMDAQIIESHGIVIFANYTELIAYDKDGIKWKSKRLTYSDLKIISITQNHIECEFWNLRIDAIDRFFVDINTGNKIVGSEDIWRD